MRRPLAAVLVASLAVLPGSQVAAAEAEAALPAGSVPMPPEMQAHLLEGVDSIYRMQFDRAEAAAKRAIAINPEHPHAYMGLAGVAWTRYVYESDQSDPKLIDAFAERTRETIEVAERWLKKHPRDANGLMALGAAYGISSRLMVIRKQWIKAYWHGRKAVNVTREAVKADPKLWDAYLGVGMYDYYSDLYPHFIGALAKIVLRGNRARGIETLKLVAEKGRLSQSNAKILLVEIYTEDPFGAKDPAKAIAIMKELRAKYPESAMVHSAELVALFTAARYEEVVSGARDYLERVKKGRYNDIERGKGFVILGCGLWAAGKKDEALGAFRESMKVDFNGAPSRWAVFAHIKAGNLLDALGRREEALAEYKFAIKQPDLWDFRGLAKGYVSKPYAHALPDRIPPP